MAPRAPRRSIPHRFVRTLAVLVLLSPAWLGPAAGPLMVAMGAFEHACACGMAPGKCGCPTCARLEHERHTDGQRPTLKIACEDPRVLLPGAPLPPCVPAGAVALLDAERTGDRARPAPGQTFASPDLRPPTPPPRDLRL